MKNTNSLTRNQKRRLSYQAMAADQNKDSRNHAISEALGEGAGNLTAKATGYEKEVQGRYANPKKIIIPTMPSAPSTGGRAAKRARLKAQRSKKVADTWHPNGGCGNVGCRTCNKQADLTYLTLHQQAI